MRAVDSALLVIVLTAAVLLAAACSSDDDPPTDSGAAPATGTTPESGDEAAAGGAGAFAEGLNHRLKQQFDMSITVASETFNEKRRIGKKHTCVRMSQNDPNVSVSFGWEGVPDSAISIAVIMDSTESPGDLPWTHWIIWNIPPDITELPEGSPSEELVSVGVRQGANESGGIGYLGPCPPVIIVTNGATGDMSRTKTENVKPYYFTVYALDVMLDLQEGATKQQLLDAIDGHVLTAGRLKGERQGDIVRRNQ